MGGRGSGATRNSSLQLTTPEEIDDMLMELNDDDFKKQMSITGFRYFGGDFGRDLNAYLHSNSDLSLNEMRPDYAGAIERLDNSMVNIPREIVAERYVDERTLPGFKSSKPEAMVGKTIHTDGYLSATLDAKNTDFEFSNYPARVIIQAPVKTKGILGANRKEAEVLFHRNSDYIITSYEVGTNHYGRKQIIYYAKLRKGN